MKNILTFIFILISLMAGAQTQHQKVAALLKILNYNNDVIPNATRVLDELSIDADKAMSAKIDSLRKIFIPEKSTAKITTAFHKIFTQKETDTLYQFLTSPVGKKFMAEHSLIQPTIDKEFKDELDALLDLLDASGKVPPITDSSFVIASTPTTYKTYSQDVVDRVDGFYLLTDINENDTIQPAIVPSLQFNTIKKVTRSFTTPQHQFVINMLFNEQGTKVLHQLTQNNIGKLIAIIINKKIVSAPYISSAIPNGELQLSGLPTLEAATTLAEELGKYIAN